MNPERELAALSGTLASRGISAYIAVAPSAAVLITGDDIVVAAQGLYWWRTRRIREGRDVLAHHLASDPDGAARRLARRVASAQRRGDGTAGRDAVIALSRRMPGAGDDSRGPEPAPGGHQ